MAADPSASYWAKYFVTHPDMVMGPNKTPVKRTSPFPAGYWEKFFQNHPELEMGPDGKPRARGLTNWPAPAEVAPSTPAAGWNDAAKKSYDAIAKTYGVGGVNEPGAY